LDSYHNLSLKHLSTYQWIYLKCGENAVNHSMKMPKWLLGVNDDFLINVVLALEVAKENPNADLM
jgi:hypothetical protein